MVKPAGISLQIGMNPLGAALTPDGRFLITSNDDEREGGFPSYQSATNKGGYSLTVVDTALMTVVSQRNVGTFFIGLQVTGAGPYVVWASGGPDNNVKLFDVSAGGVITGPSTTIPILPKLPSTSGYVSNYTPDASLNTPNGSGNLPPVPTGFSRTGNTRITFPAGSALSPDGKYLYVACNGDNSVAVIDTASKAVIRQELVGYFPYGVSVSADGKSVFVANWGVTEYKFKNPTYSGANLTAIGTTGTNQPDGFYVPVTNTGGSNPKTSSVSVLTTPTGNGGLLSLLGSIYQGHPLDEFENVGDTHPSATRSCTIATRMSST